MINEGQTALNRFERDADQRLLKDVAKERFAFPLGLLSVRALQTRSYYI
jgi:hypothetical protein